MEEVSTLLSHHRILALDTNCFIYYLEGKSYLEILNPLFVAMESGAVQGVTSVLTITEILVKPMSLGLEEVADEYTALLCSYPHLRVIPLTLEIAVRAAAIRSTYRVKTPDAIHLATAWENQATVFFTNDLDLPLEIGMMRVIQVSRLSRSRIFREFC